MVHLLLAVIYLSFISLGLPDSLLGAAWPTIYPQLNIPISYAGIISMTISAGTVVSSLMSDRFTRRFGTGTVTAVSVGITAGALFGFSASHSFWALCLWAIPYGLGAGSVDASINNYVAVHYSSRHMSWLHCMWGVGAAAGPYIMWYVLTVVKSWNQGYRTIGILQMALTLILFCSLPLWKNAANEHRSEPADISAPPLTLPQVIRLPGTKEGMLCFFCYCALEQTAGLWASSYLALYKGIPSETAAFFGSMFFIGITVGRGLCGFIASKLNDTQMTHLGQAVAAIGIVIMLVPADKACSLLGLILIGLGCAPIYPSMMHATPINFGIDKSQAVIGTQMASAYVGTCIMPALFGLIANQFGTSLLPIYLSELLAVMTLMHRKLLKITG